MRGGKSPVTRWDQTVIRLRCSWQRLAAALELRLGLELLVSNRGQEEQDARFWDSALEAQAVLLSPIISQHPAPPHVQLLMHLVALIGRNNNKKALHESSCGTPHPWGHSAGAASRRHRTPRAPGTLGAAAAVAQSCFPSPSSFPKHTPCSWLIINQRCCLHRALLSPAKKDIMDF